MTKEEMAKLMSIQMKKCFGEAMNITERNGYAFVGWPHIRYFFYVYTYAMGKITSKALYKKYTEDKNYIEKIIKFMSLGGSMAPADIFKSIGVDITKPEFWTSGLKNIEEDVDLLEKLVNKKGKR
jgi:oligoendopeptidase F